MSTTPTNDKAFGNLSFSNYTMETDAERCVLALQAALKVHGYTPAHPTMKKVLRLKRSMGRNKIRRYSFDLVQAKPEAAAAAPKPVPANDYTDVLAPILERITGFKLHSKEAKVATSGHLIVKFVLVGTLDIARIEPGTKASFTANKAREAIALEVMRDLNELTSFSAQPLRIRIDKGRMAVAVQCIYRGPDDSKKST